MKKITLDILITEPEKEDKVLKLTLEASKDMQTDFAAGMAMFVKLLQSGVIPSGVFRRSPEPEPFPEDFDDE